MQRNRLALALTLLSLLVLARPSGAEDARWIRYPVISPDGRWIAFGCHGDLWVVPAAGGEARPITTHVGYEKEPVWAPDSNHLAFASDRHGNFDVFLTTIDGGPARRLTYHSAHDIPSGFTPDGKAVLFSSRRLDAPAAALATPYLPELYAIDVEGGRPRQILTTPAEHARYRPDGKQVVYEDLKGYENAWRKHHTSSVTRDIWIWDVASGGHRRWTDFAGEDRDPEWSADGKTIFFLSERGGSFNVWSAPAEGGGEPVALTRHGPHPVRFLSVANDGTIAYGHRGEIWLRPADGEPHRVDVRLAASDRVNPATIETMRKGATEFAVAPGEQEIAFVVRGEIFVASTKHGTTKRITATPEQERSVVWAPDGRALYYAGERDGAWNLYRTSLARDDEKFFFRATLLKEEPVLVGVDETFQPQVSPDGKRIAYLHNRDEIRVLDLATGQSRTVVPPERNYSYSDGDIGYEWSPDSRWLAFTFLPRGRWIDDVGVVDATTGERVNLTLSGYEEYRPRWSRDGKVLLFYSDRLGRRSHGGWGSDGDVFGLYLTQAAYDRARLTEEEYELLVEEEKKDKDKDKDDEKKEDEKKDGAKKEEKKKPPEPVEIELEDREERVRRLTIYSSPVTGFDLSPDGEKLVYFARVEESWDLRLDEIRKGETKKLASFGEERPGDVRFDEKGEAVFVQTGDGGLAKVSIDDGKVKKVAFAAEMDVNGPRERAYIFEHCWRQTKRKFYEPKLHGADWEGLKEEYGRFVPDLASNHDLAELLSEMVGELNASHTGSGYRIPQEGADKTASLGLLFDPAFQGDGLKVAEVLARGPADRAGSKIVPGLVLTHIDGVALTARVNHHGLLNRKADQPVRLAFAAPGGAVLEEVVKPIEQRASLELLYRRWVKRSRDHVAELSGGQVGYVHVRGMNEASFRHLYQEALGRFAEAKALVVDTRFNGGGWLHDDLVQFLGGRPYAVFQPRGKERGEYGGEPSQRWYRPVVVLQSEGNYSDAHVFPYAFKQLGLGKLVGTPVAGTGTAVWWEGQIDPTLYYGIPQVGMVMPDGRYLENSDLEPDVEVFNDPQSTARGEDRQLAKAVEVALAEVK